ncbi:hypothetical protein ACJX0J_032066, partial [Zea mays]
MTEGCFGKKMIDFGLIFVARSFQTLGICFDSTCFFFFLAFLGNSLNSRLTVKDLFTAITQDAFPIFIIFGAISPILIRVSMAFFLHMRSIILHGITTDIFEFIMVASYDYLARDKAMNFILLDLNLFEHICWARLYMPKTLIDSGGIEAFLPCLFSIVLVSIL